MGNTATNCRIRSFAGSVSLLALSAALLLGGCNKLGLAGPRTMPEDATTTLGPKRPPQKNIEQIGQQRSSGGMMPASVSLPPMAAMPPGYGGAFWSQGTGWNGTPAMPPPMPQPAMPPPMPPQAMMADPYAAPQPPMAMGAMPPQPYPPPGAMYMPGYGPPMMPTPGMMPPDMMPQMPMEPPPQAGLAIPPPAPPVASPPIPVAPTMPPTASLSPDMSAFPPPPSTATAPAEPPKLTKRSSAPFATKSAAAMKQEPQAAEDIKTPAPEKAPVEKEQASKATAEAKVTPPPPITTDESTPEFVPEKRYGSAPKLQASTSGSAEEWDRLAAPVSPVDRASLAEIEPKGYKGPRLGTLKNPMGKDDDSAGGVTVIASPPVPEPTVRDIAVPTPPQALDAIADAAAKASEEGGSGLAYTPPGGAPKAASAPVAPPSLPIADIPSAPPIESAAAETASPDGYRDSLDFGSSENEITEHVVADDAPIRLRPPSSMGAVSALPQSRYGAANRNVFY